VERGRNPIGLALAQVSVSPNKSQLTAHKVVLRTLPRGLGDREDTNRAVVPGLPGMNADGDKRSAKGFAPHMAHAKLVSLEQQGIVT